MVYLLWKEACRATLISISLSSQGKLIIEPISENFIINSVDREDWVYELAELEEPMRVLRSIDTGEDWVEPLSALPKCPSRELSSVSRKFARELKRKTSSSASRVTRYHLMRCCLMLTRSIGEWVMMWWVVRRCSSDDVDEWKRGDVDEWKRQRAKIAEIKITGRNSGLLQGSTADFVMCGKP